MSACIIANVDVTHPEQYEDYKKLSSLAMQVHGAEVLARGGPRAALTGASLNHRRIQQT